MSCKLNSARAPFPSENAGNYLGQGCSLLPTAGCLQSDVAGTFACPVTCGTNG